ncbi:MAG: pyrroloquinoline quinone biosynthesis peptide chaperone PqqD [Pelagibacterales bacterium]|nr:pyrroloquinoline quinone biosynthesis peptide chaperone PqqD [Pelagibacterales bacterium]OUU63093.1 MAG: pyrroloquinoline quinone biosynthesis protein PqqD [Alphaproteobacteria bacterium TMED62]|tara:strand:- start:1979 stop:2269 length:291 start_codon:yes stop_codon:yes gene_type:complete
MTKLLNLKENDIPKLPRHAKLRFDEARKKWIINAPERVFELDEIAGEVMQLIDGKSSIIGIVDILVKKFEGASKDVVKKDVLSLLQPLAEKGFIVI